MADCVCTGANSSAAAIQDVSGEPICDKGPINALSYVGGKELFLLFLNTITISGVLLTQTMRTPTTHPSLRTAVCYCMHDMYADGCADVPTDELHLAATYLGCTSAAHALHRSAWLLPCGLSSDRLCAGRLCGSVVVYCLRTLPAFCALCAAVCGCVCGGYIYTCVMHHHQSVTITHHRCYTKLARKSEQVLDPVTEQMFPVLYGRRVYWFYALSVQLTRKENTPPTTYAHTPCTRTVTSLETHTHRHTGTGTQAHAHTGWLDVM